MKNEDLFNYQYEAMRLLINGFDKDRMVHAYLLDGEAGTGSIDAAKYMAKKLICKKDNAPCMSCGDCKRIDSDTHLNVLYIEPIGDMIKKEQIENLIHEFSMSSLDGMPQIYIIKDADKMNVAAQNSLLKFLEEPNPNHFAFLTSEVDVAMKYIEEGKITNMMNIAKKIVDKDLKKKDSYIEYFRNKVLFLEEKDKFYHRLFLDILILIYQELLNRISLHEAKYFDDILDNVKIQEIDKKEMIRKLELLNLYQERFNYHINLDLQYTSLFSKL